MKSYKLSMSISKNGKGVSSYHSTKAEAKKEALASVKNWLKGGKKAYYRILPVNVVKCKRCGSTYPKDWDDCPRCEKSREDARDMMMEMA